MHTVQFQDENENAPIYIAALARSPEELCNELVFKSLRNLHEQLLITKKGKKMGIILKSCKGDKSSTSFIVQAEFAEDIEGFGKGGKNKSMKSTNK